jgi:hypothetical protein
VYVLFLDNSGQVLNHLRTTDLLLSLQTFSRMIARLSELHYALMPVKDVANHKLVMLMLRAVFSYL